MVTNSACAISRLVIPSAAILATRRSLAVSASRPLSRSRRGRAPAVTSSSRAGAPRHADCARLTDPAGLVQFGLDECERLLAHSLREGQRQRRAPREHVRVLETGGGLRDLLAGAQVRDRCPMGPAGELGLGA